jgi:hypothetical protein
VKVLVETSIWIDHLDRPHGHLRELRETGAVCPFSVVLGQLAGRSIQKVLIDRILCMAE